MTNVIVWAETTYKTNKCPKCNNMVRGTDQMPLPETLYDQTEGWLICQKCGSFVGKIMEDKRSKEELEDKLIDNRGYWDEGIKH